MSQVRLNALTVVYEVWIVQLCFPCKGVHIVKVLRENRLPVEYIEHTLNPLRRKNKVTLINTH